MCLFFGEAGEFVHGAEEEINETGMFANAQ